ncbi:S2-RNase [Pyrus ussuriensis x Pyrus communis]|uniref:S2-RNase n=1 Tax=Pyrus ussuriensis x Pyrus communis TaxID=2448454 RepID=A0A5N5GV55_9ROSA|nr:S2-RNase [Pyrus ussuriensis x Pyrus communis]
MAPRSRRNTTKSGNASDAGEDASRLYYQENLDEYDIVDIIAAIHAMDWKSILKPPYPTSILHMPYPKGYETPNFVLFDGRKGSRKEHISHFIDALGPYASNCNLHLREFSKSLTDHAYTWYKTLAPGSIQTWEELTGRFSKGWGDKDANLMDFAPSLSDDDFTIDILEEYNEEAAEEHLFNQEMMVVTLYDRPTLVDTGSSINILPLVVLIAAGVPTTKVVRQICVCVNFRDHNDVCLKDDFLLPIIEIMVDATTVKGLTAFHTPKGIYCYKVMPFGLNNAGATYQCAMQKNFNDMLHKNIECYVDDVVVKTKKGSNHLKDLRMVFNKLRHYNLKMNLLKCAFGLTSGKFLGFIVKHRGIEVDQSKIKVI